MSARAAAAVIDWPGVLEVLAVCAAIREAAEALQSAAVLGTLLSPLVYLALSARSKAALVPTLPAGLV